VLPNRKLLNIDHCPVQCRALRWQRTDRERAAAGRVDVARHLDAASLGQIGDHAAVRHVAVDDAWFARLQRADQRGTVFMGWSELARQLGEERFRVACVVMGLVVVPALGQIFGDERGVLAEIGNILR
jgi:hypothetical protein